MTDQQRQVLEAEKQLQDSLLSIREERKFNIDKSNVEYQEQLDKIDRASKRKLALIEQQERLELGRNIVKIVAAVVFLGLPFFAVLVVITVLIIKVIWKY